MSKTEKPMEFLIETDLLVDHLHHSNQEIPSALEILMAKGICFTTVINASEVFYLAKNEDEVKIIKDLLSALKVLGIHQRYSLSVPEFGNSLNTSRDALIAAAAKINKLPIAAINFKRYKNTEIEIINLSDLIK